MFVIPCGHAPCAIARRALRARACCERTCTNVAGRDPELPWHDERVEQQARARGRRWGRPARHPGRERQRLLDEGPESRTHTCVEEPRKLEGRGDPLPGD